MAVTTALAPAMTATPLDGRQVFLEHAGFVLRVVRRMGVRSSDVEDVAQEVFLIVHRKLHTYDGSSSVRTWLFGITLRVVSDHNRKAYRRRELPSDQSDRQMSAANQPEDLRRFELRAELDRALARLDPAKRAVFVLYDLEGVPMAEIAQGLGCPLFTAYSRLREARQQVRLHFERAGSAARES